MSAALSVPLGLVAFIPLFVPLFAGSADVAGRSVEAFAFAIASLAAYFAFGTVIGSINPRFWPIAGVLAWVAVFDAAYNLAYAAADPTYPDAAVPTALFVLVGPLLVALGGGYAGRALAARRPHQR